MQGNNDSIHVETLATHIIVHVYLGVALIKPKKIMEGLKQLCIFCAVGDLFKAVQGSTASHGSFVGAGGGVVSSAATFAVPGQQTQHD